MRGIKPISYLSPILIIVIGFVCVLFLSNFLEENKPALPDDYIDEDLSLQGARLSGYSLGMEGLVADWYWARSLQYIGNKFVKSKDPVISLDDLRPLNPRLLYPLLDSAVDLDPQFIAVYAYGATVLPAIDSKQAVAIAKKGIRNNPEEWRLYQYLGFIYWKLKDYDRAAKIYKRGSQINGAPRFMKMMAAKMLNDGGSRETARSIYRQIRDEAQDSRTRENAELRLLQLDFFDERDLIEKGLRLFRKKNGRCPGYWKEALPALSRASRDAPDKLRVDQHSAVVDPAGVPLLLKRSSTGECTVALDRAKTTIPIR